MIEECLPPGDGSLRELIVPENSRYQPTEALKKVLPNIDRSFYCSFLHQVIANVTELAPILLRELNEIWKFFVYFIRMFKHYNADSQ